MMSRAGRVDEQDFMFHQKRTSRPDFIKREFKLIIKMLSILRAERNHYDGRDGEPEDNSKPYFKDLNDGNLIFEAYLNRLHSKVLISFNRNATRASPCL